MVWFGSLFLCKYDIKHLKARPCKVKSLYKQKSFKRLTRVVRNVHFKCRVEMKIRYSFNTGAAETGKSWAFCNVHRSSAQLMVYRQHNIHGNKPIIHYLIFLDLQFCTCANIWRIYSLISKSLLMFYLTMFLCSMFSAVSYNTPVYSSFSMNAHAHSHRYLILICNGYSVLSNCLPAFYELYSQAYKSN